MSYIINNSRGNIVAVVDDGTVNTTATGLALIGRSVTNYGEYQNENYVYLLENFANSTAPVQPVLGQLWYDSGNDKLCVYSTTNTWVSLASENYVQSQKISPAFTGVPTAPTAISGTNTTQLATTAFVQNNKASPVFTGIPSAPTAIADTNTTQLATTAFVQNQLSSASGFSSAGIVDAAGFTTNGTISATGNVLGGNLATGGNVVALGQISASGNITGGNLAIGGNVVALGQISAAGNITGGNINTAGQIVTNSITVIGNITSGNVLGGANVNATLFTGITVSVSGNITGGNLVSLGSITANNIIANNISTSGSSAFRLPNLDQIQINALIPQNGDMVYNTTDNLPQIYQNGNWNNFTISYYS